MTVICGPMFSGKSSRIVSYMLRNRAANNKIELFSPNFDNRYGANKVSSHSKLSVNATSVFNSSEIRTITQNLKLDILVFDEIQFFMKPYFYGDFVGLIKEYLIEGKTILCAGLDMDWKGNPFETTGKLLAMADNVEKLKAICNVTGNDASKTYKVSQLGDSIELGETDKYEARCNKVWNCPK